MNAIARWLDRYLEESISSVLFIVFTSLMFYNVVMRYVFQDAVPWAEELTLLLFVWFVWLSIPYATKLDSHAKVSMLQDLLPARLKAGLNLLLDVFAIIIFVAIIVAAIQFLNHNAVRGKTGLLIPYPMWLFYLPAPVGLVLTIYRLVQKMPRTLRQSFNPPSRVEGA
jgi:TRAP-type C4-dicarboxylate transport system permease small subunit